jgi:hypothetical protein
VLGAVRRRQQPWQERGIARRGQKRVAPGLARGVEADVVGGGVEAARDVAEEIQREVRPRPPERVVRQRCCGGHHQSQFPTMAAYVVVEFLMGDVTCCVIYLVLV